MTQPSREFEIGMAALTVAPAAWWRGWMRAVDCWAELMGPESPASFNRDINIIALRRELRKREMR